MSAHENPHDARTPADVPRGLPPHKAPDDHNRLRIAGQILFYLALAGAVASYTLMVVDSDWDGGFRFAAVIIILLAARAAQVPSSVLGVFAALLLFATWAAVAHWYRQVTLLDVAVHFFTPGSLAVVAYFVFERLKLLPDIRESAETKLRSWAPAVWVVLLGTTAAVVWEFYEWGIEHWTASSILVGYTDTVVDLLAGMLGSALGGVLVLRWRTHYHRHHRVPTDR